MQAPDVPAGLRNLGNTCYVNAAMQFLQAIPEFRHALYVLEPELAEQDVIRQLRYAQAQQAAGSQRAMQQLQQQHTNCRVLLSV
jgi:ubiquitin C-terminal hydrolase